MPTRLRRTITPLLLALVLMSSTNPVSAADFPRTTTPLGFIEGAGNVYLRGLTVNQEATLFSGDDIRTGSKSHARLMLANGSQVELFDNSSSNLVRVEDGVRLTLTTGHLGFSVSANPLTISLKGFEVLPGVGTTGGVAFLRDGYVGIRVMTGSALVVNTRTKQSRTVTSGNVNVIHLPTGQTNVPLEQLASVGTPPLPIPGALPRRQGGGPCCTPGQWAVIIGGIGAGTATALYFVLRDSSPSSP